MRRILASDSSTPSPRGSAPPERPVPAPRATTGTLSSWQARSTSRTSSSEEGSATTIGSCRYAESPSHSYERVSSSACSTASAGSRLRRRPATSAWRRKSIPVTATFIASSLQVILRPRQAVLGPFRRQILGAAPAPVAEAVDEREQGRKVDLAGPRLVASGNVGELHVPDAREIALDGRGEIISHHAHVVQVVLQLDVDRCG